MHVIIHNFIPNDPMDGARIRAPCHCGVTMGADLAVIWCASPGLLIYAPNPARAFGSSATSARYLNGTILQTDYHCLFPFVVGII